MFETLVTGVLTNVMGSFIDPKCFSSDKINVAVWSGYVVLRDLELKPEVIAHPSINLVRGVVGSIELKIPWNRLQSESVVLTVDDVYLLVRTEEDIEGVLMDMDEFTIKKQLLEQLYEEAKKKQEAEQKQDATAAKDDGFTARLVNKIIDNIELHIRRIHVRLEDHVTGDHPFAVGVTVESVHAQSTNSNWQPSYVDSSKNSEPRIYKMVELNHLSIYLDPHCDVLRNQRIDFKNCPLEEFCHAFNHSIPKRFDDRHPLQLYPTHQRHHFILKPVDASARLIVNRDPFDTSIPKFEVDISIAEIGIRLEDSQYCDLLYLASAFQVPEHHKKYQQYRKYRPRSAVSEDSASEWWKYAITAIMDDNRKKKLRWSWKYMKERREDRARYKQIWERHMRQLEMGPNRGALAVESEDEDTEDEDDSRRPQDASRKHDGDRSSVHSSMGSGPNKNAPLNKRARADVIALEAIERKRPIEDILFFRYLVDKKMDEENEIRATMTNDHVSHHQVPMPPFSDSESVDTDVTESSLPTELRYRSWGKWMFGWTSQIGAAPSPSDSSATPKRGFPEVELRELFKIVEYEPAKRAKRRNRSKDPSNGNGLHDHDEDEEEAPELESRITLSLGKGSITLSSDPETNKRLARDDPNYGTRYAPTDFLLGSFTHLQVAAITKGDSTKVDVSLQTIDAFDESADSMAFSRLLTRKHDRALSTSEDDGGMMNMNRMTGPIFLMSYETNPVGVAADAALYVHMEPLEIVFSPTARCWGRLGSFMSTPQVLGLWAELEVASFNDIVNLKARTEAKLNYVMANRVALSMDLRIQAPLIVIPESDSDYNCARMVIDLGHINFRTDRLSKLDGETAALSASMTGGFTVASAPSSLALSSSYSSPQLTSSMSFVRQLYDDAEKGEGTIRWKEEFYDKFTLSITNVHVLLIPHGKAAMSGAFSKSGMPLPTSYALNGSNPSPDWELIERFNINVTLRTSVLPLDATLTRLYVHADLPALTFNMSLEKYFQLLALVERFGASSDPQQAPNVPQKPSLSSGSTFLDSEGTFNPDRRESFLSVSALKKFTDEDEPRNNKKMELDELLGGGRSDSDGLSDADSDDTWFSITSGNVELPFTSGEGSSDLNASDLDGFSLENSAKNGVPTDGGGPRAPSHSFPPPIRERKRGRRGSLTLPSGDLIDRRLFVCTFTVPVISIQLKKPQGASVLPPTSFRYDSSGIFDDDIPESGTLLVKFEGFRVRIAKKTLSAQVDLCFRSLDVEDFVDVGGRSSEYLMFSCPTITAPYNLAAPPRRGMPYAGGAAPRRRVSRQRERVISFQRTETSTPSAAPTNLLELVFSSTSDRQTCEESSRDLNVRFGAIHVVFDQAYVCSLLELFEETWSRISAKPAAPIALEDDGDEDFLDAIPPPLDLTPSVTQEFSLPVTLTESVLADLERARNDFLAREKSFERQMAAAERSESRPPVVFSIGIQLQSLSVLFCDRGDTIASGAVVGIKVHVSTGAQGGADMNIRAGIKDVRVFDLAVSKDAMSAEDRPGSHTYRKPFVEVFGLERHHQGSGSGKIIAVDAVLSKTSEKDPLSPASGEASAKSRINVVVQPTQLQVQSAFIENVVNYVVLGAIATWYVSKEDALSTTRVRRRRRTESFASDNTGTPTHRAYTPDAGSSRRLTPSLAATGGTEPVPGGDSKEEAVGSSDSFLANCEISIELFHPCIVVPCGRGYSQSDEALIIDLGVIKIQNGATMESDPASSGSPIVSVNVDGVRVLTRSENLKILEDTTIRIDVGLLESAALISQVLTVAVSPLTLNVGEKYLCLALDLWNDVVNPTIQVVSGIPRSPLVMKTSKPDVESTLSADAPPQAGAPRGFTVELTVASLQLVMVSKPVPEFEMWLKSTMDTAEVQVGRDANAAATPGSPRRRRHNFSFAQDDHNGFKSVTPAPSVVPVAELVLSTVVVSLKAQKAPGENGDCQQLVDACFSVHEVCVRDVVADGSEFMRDVLCRVPDARSHRSIEPQVKVEFGFIGTQAADADEAESVITVGAKVSSARVCILPRSLLRIERYAVGVALSLGQKLAEQDPRIISSAEQHSSALAVAENPTGGYMDELSASQDRRVGYGPSSTARGRKNSIAESILESTKVSKLEELTETPSVNDGQSSHRSTRIVWKSRVDLANLQLWLLSSDRQRDAFGLCLSSRFVLVVEQPATRFASGSPDTNFERLCLSSSAKAADARVHLGSPVDMTTQSFELIEPFTSVFDLSVTQYERHAPNDSADQLTQTRQDGPSPSWRAWNFVKSSIAVSSITSRLSYKDLPVLTRIVSAVSAVVSAEAHVRLPLASLSANDPYADLLDLDSDDGDPFSQDQHASEQSQLPQIVNVTFEMGSVKFRLINNLVDEDSPVVGFRVGPLHLRLHDVSGSKTTIDGSCALEAWYHNLRLVASEPLVEPWNVTLNCTQDRSHRRTSAEPGVADEVDDHKSPWTVTISSTEFLQWNVTDALVTNIMAASRAWEWMSRGGAIDSSDRSEYSTYWIRNETGLKLRYWGPSCRDNLMNPGDEEPLLFAARPRSKSGEYPYGESDSDRFIGRQIFIAVEDGNENGSTDHVGDSGERARRWESEFSIPVDQADSRMYALVDLDSDMMSSRVRKCECVIDVLVERGCKVFVVRSTLILENNTASDLEVEYVPPLRRSASPPFRAGTPRGHLIPSWKAVVGSSSTIPVPINLVSATDGYLMVRPPDMKSSSDGVVVQLPKAYAKKRVHLPLFDRALTPATDTPIGDDGAQTANGEPQCAIKFHRLYGDRPVRPFMMSATLAVANNSLYQRKVAFQPPLVIHNLTAGPLEYCIATPNDWMPATDGVNNTSTSVNLGWEDCQQRLRERGTINVADSLVWHLCDWDTPLELQIRIKGFEWSEPLRIVEDLPEDVYRIRMADLSSNAHLYISAETQTVRGRCREVSLFVPYWIVNLTGLKLEYEHDDERASYEHTTMLLAGQKRLDRDELLLKEEQSRASSHAVHSHLVRPVAFAGGANKVDGDGESGTTDQIPSHQQPEDQRRRHPGLIPSIPPIKGLLDLLPKPVEDVRVVGQLEVLQACHSSSQPERGCVRVRVNEVDRRMGSGMSDGRQKNWTESIVLDQPGTSGELEATDFSLDRIYSIGYSISTAKARYSRTKVIMLTPRFMIINAMNASVEVCHSSPRSSPGIDDQGSGGGVVSALNPALRLEPGGYADFHWSLPFARSKTIRCRLAEAGWSWSGAVPLGESREYVVRMRNDSTRATKLVRVVLKLDGPCVCVYLREESSSAPPYRIENYSLETFRIHQHGVRRSEILLPHHSLDYAWDEPTQERALVVDMLPSAAGDNSRPLRIGSFILDKIHRFPDSLGGTLGIEITADGPTRVLRFTDTRIRAAGAIDASGNASVSETKDARALQTFPSRFLSKTVFELRLHLQGVGVSIVDSSPRELIYISFAGLSLDVFVSDGDDDAGRSTGAAMSRLAKEQHPKVVALRFQMRDFQIDNQLAVTPYPVLLRFSNPGARTRIVDGKVVNVPVVDVCLVKHDGYAGIDFIRHFNLRVLPLHMRVDGSLLYQLLPVFVHTKMSSTREPLSGKSWEASKLNQATLLMEEYNTSLEVGVEILDVMREDGATSVLASSSTVTDRENAHSQHEIPSNGHRPNFTVSSHTNHHGRLVSKAEAKKLYFEEFHIDPIRATVSFSFGASAGAMVEGLNSWAGSGRNSPITVGPLRLIINAIGTSLAKIANAPFHLKAISIGHSFIQPDALASRLVSHYQSEALRQAYVILGSVDVFGNPMVAWRNMKGGFQDFINEPVHGISKSPTEFALGMGRGTYSLVRASVYTFLDFNARILAASSLGLSEACLKLDEYTGYPATRNIYQGFAQGISGIVVSPIRAVELNGVRGVLPGVFAGVFGFVLKPLLGVSLAASTTVASLRDAIDPNTKALLMRARPPRHIDLRTRRLKVYSYVESFGEEMVGKLRGGRYRSDGYVGHVDLKQKCFLVTRKRILYIDVKAGQKFEVVWELQADEIVLVEWQSANDESTMALYYIEEDYTPRRRAALAAKGMLLSKHVVPLPENRVLFVRAMLQQQERSLFVEESIHGNATATILPSSLPQRTRSMDQLTAYQQHFPSAYPIFKFPALAATKSMANVQPPLGASPAVPATSSPAPSDDDSGGELALDHDIPQIVEEESPSDDHDDDSHVDDHD